MLKNILVIILLTASWAFAFWLGSAQTEIKYITKEKEVIKYEKTCAINLMVKPNLADTAIIRLFDAEQL